MPNSSDSSNKRPASPLPHGSMPAEKRRTTGGNASTNDICQRLTILYSGSYVYRKPQQLLSEETQAFFSRLFEFLSLLQEEYQHTLNPKKQELSQRGKIYMPKRLLAFLILDSFQYEYKLTLSMLKGKIGELINSFRENGKDLESVCKSLGFDKYRQNIQLLQRMYDCVNFETTGFPVIFQLLILPFVKNFLEKYSHPDSCKGFKNVAMKDPIFESVCEATRAVIRRSHTYGVKRQKSNDGDIEALVFNWFDSSSYRGVAKVLQENKGSKSGRVLTELSKTALPPHVEEKKQKPKRRANVSSADVKQKRPKKRVNGRSENTAKPEQLNIAAHIEQQKRIIAVGALLELRKGTPKKPSVDDGSHIRSAFVCSNN